MKNQNFIGYPSAFSSKQSPANPDTFDGGVEDPGKSGSKTEIGEDSEWKQKAFADAEDEEEEETDSDDDYDDEEE